MLSLLTVLADGGPIYAETTHGLGFVEPYNAISSLAYLIPAFYWITKLQRRLKEHLFLAFCLPLLMAGGIGSTLYHGFRSSPFLLMMDVLPIALVTLMVSVYFWVKVLRNGWHVFFTVLPFLLSRFFIVKLIASAGGLVNLEISRQMSINISYFISGVMIFLPALILVGRYRGRHSVPLVISCLLFMLGLAFREIDSWNIPALPMGTHFLWHISTAAGAGILGQYLFLLRKDELEEHLPATTRS